VEDHQQKLLRLLKVYLIQVVAVGVMVQTFLVVLMEVQVLLLLDIIRLVLVQY
jgi:hypothetical protein